MLPTVTSKSPTSRGAYAATARSESFAYPISPTSSMLSKVQYLCRQHSSTILIFSLCLLVLFYVMEEEVTGGSHHHLRSPSLSISSTMNSGYMWGGAIRPGYFYPEDAVQSSGEFLFAAVTDLDQLSKDASTKDPVFSSTLLGGSLKVNSGSSGAGTGIYYYEIHLHTSDTRKLVTKHNEAGRGAEFSELSVFQNRLLTFDDRTGVIFEILNDENGRESFVVPRFIFSEGPGETDKGMKWEWSTVKDDELYLGSMGKEYTLSDGSVKNRNNLWIVIIDGSGKVRRVDWTTQYNFVRHILKADLPGYMIIEACRWSSVLKSWVFLPRRISYEAYDEVKDETMGGHQLVVVNEDFTNAKVVDIAMESLDPLKGFSTFSFVPNSGDQHILAVRSVEENCVDFTPSCQQRSFFVVLDISTGKQISAEVKYPDKVKYEGLEFVDINARPPRS